MTRADSEESLLEPIRNLSRAGVLVSTLEAAPNHASDHLERELAEITPKWFFTNPAEGLP